MILPRKVIVKVNSISCQGQGQSAAENYFPAARVSVIVKIKAKNPVPCQCQNKGKISFPLDIRVNYFPPKDRERSNLFPPKARVKGQYLLNDRVKMSRLFSIQVQSE
jgi:hypothetical protein